MIRTSREFRQLAEEHRVLLAQYGRVQTRCSELVRAQANEIEALRAQAMRLRATVIARDTALAWAREDHAALEAAIPGLPRRRALARRVEGLVAHIQDLMKERLHWRRPATTVAAPLAIPIAAPAPRGAAALRMHADALDAGVEDLERLEAGLVAADLVICQTGCLSHGAYWRVHDHCRRTGKACVLVAQPDAVRIVRIREPAG